MMHVDENRAGDGMQENDPGARNPHLMALEQLKQRMMSHVQKTHLVNQKLAYRVICLEQKLRA